jgi:hypothetical protein
MSLDVLIFPTLAIILNPHPAKWILEQVSGTLICFIDRFSISIEKV